MLQYKLLQPYNLQTNVVTVYTHYQGTEASHEIKCQTLSALPVSASIVRSRNVLSGSALGSSPYQAFLHQNLFLRKKLFLSGTQRSVVEEEGQARGSEGHRLMQGVAGYGGVGVRGDGRAEL